MNRFGFQWKKYYRIDPDYETFFKQWLFPLTPKDFKGKKVLDAGCGMGRNSYWVLKWGAKQVVGFDEDERCIAVSRENLKKFQFRGETKSIYDIEYKDFDIVLCLGVIHHLENSCKAIENLINATRQGGIIVIHIYSRENNGWIIRFIDPIRKAITSKLPLSLLSILVHMPATLLWIYAKINKNHPFLKTVKKIGYWQFHNVVFDHLLPPIADYYTRDEALNLLRGLKNIRIYNVNNNSWTVLAEKI